MLHIPKQQTSVQGWLEKKPKKELIELLLKISREYPQFGEQLATSANLEQRKANPVIEAIRTNIEALESAWEENGFVSLDSDFAHIEEQLAALLDAGYADHVVELGGVFLRIAPNCYEYSNNDDWTITSGISICLDIILTALAQSSRSHAEQLLWYIDAELADSYGVFDGTETFIDNRIYTDADWWNVAGKLKARLANQPPPSNNATYTQLEQQKSLMLWLETALEKAELPTERDAR